MYVTLISVDGYPEFGLIVSSEKASFTHERPEKINQLLVLSRFLFGWLYVGIPHGFCLLFRIFASGFLGFLAWFVVLFTGKYPEKWHAFIVGTIRWVLRVKLYLGFMTDEYPKFSGKE